VAACRPNLALPSFLSALQHPADFCGARLRGWGRAAAACRRALLSHGPSMSSANAERGQGLPGAKLNTFETRT